ncbi:MAG: preprotein translocase subunit SecA [Marinilabiliaceae bacterium]|nr:preprotein translocase subunit SecA [Marinilabiliaceae bacterium]
MSFINNLLTKIFGSKYEKDMKEIAPIVAKIKEIYPTINSLSNDELRLRTTALRQQIAEAICDLQKKSDELRNEAESNECPIDKKDSLYKEIDEIEKQVDSKVEEVLTQILPEAFAIIKDTARRFSENEEIIVTASERDREIASAKEYVTIDGDKAIWKNHWTAGGNDMKWEMVHYDVQLIGGIVLHQGKIAEMATGEGKTLVATLPVFLNALAGRGVHVVTVNDYLSKRDSEWMGPLYEFHGLTVDCIDKHRPNSVERRKAYACDITFGTNNEFGFDYLRDNGATHPEDLVQRKHNYAIVDEVDSVLIDDARTPLIISGPVPKRGEQQFEQLKPNVEKLVEAQHSMISSIFADAKKKLASDDKKEKEEGALLLFRSYKGLPKNRPLIKFLSEPGMTEILTKTENFYMQENNKNMHIATDPLYFVIDEKHKSIELTDKGIDALSAHSDEKDYFVLPDVGSEMANIEKSDKSEEEKISLKNELMQDYSVKSERLHTINQLLKAYTLFDKDIEYVVIDNQVKIVDEQTGRIMEGRRYSDGLHQALEAKERVKIEDPTQTYATITLQNYFRMYHKLSGMTGTAETEAGEFWNIYKLDVVIIPTNRPIARKDMNDIIYKTTKEKFSAVIDEIIRLHEIGRPVLVGTTSVDVSELLSRMLKMRNINHNVLNAKLHQKEADIVALAGRPGAVTIATNMAGRGTDIKLTDEVKELGGLAIIGTERHESRRVDRQLRGRAGRQGDPGSSLFFVSMEDNLMRLFGSNNMAMKLLDRTWEEGQSIQLKQMTSAIEKAQRKVEENNFGIRKRLLEYDDVMNSQREVIYKKRKHALFGERLEIDITNMIQDTAFGLIQGAKDAKDYEGLKLDFMKIFSINVPFSEDDLEKKNEDELTLITYEVAWKAIQERCEEIRQRSIPAVRRVMEEQPGRYKNIVIPITDGAHVYEIPHDLEKAYKTDCADIIKTMQKAIILMTIDDSWREHLRQLDELRTSVQNASYEQKDPLLIYKFESFNLFKSMIETINTSVVSALSKLSIKMRNEEEIAAAQAQATARMQAEMMRRKKEIERLQAQHADAQTPQQQKPITGPQAMPTGGQMPRPTMPIRVEKTVGRNEPCPCGSGKKYKNCHGKNL